MLIRHIVEQTGFEPAYTWLQTKHSAVELLPHGEDGGDRTLMSFNTDFLDQPVYRFQHIPKKIDLS